MRISDDSPDRLLRLLSTVEAERTPRADPYLSASACSMVRLIRDQAEANEFAADPGLLDIYWRGFLDEAGSFLTGQGLRELAAKIRWEASPGSYSSVYVDDTVVLTTGSLAEPPSGGSLSNISFPAGGGDCDVVGFPVGANSLFCGSSYNLGTSETNRGDRGVLNSRLANAAVVARWLGGRDLDGFVVPMLRDKWPQDGNRSEAYSLDASWPGLTAFSYSKREKGTEYCLTTTGGGVIWDFARITESGAIERPAGWDSVACNIGQDRNNRFSVRFSTMEGDYAWGQNRVDFDVQERNAVRAQLFARRLAGHETSAANHPLSALTSGLGPDVMIDTACMGESQCRDRINNARFAWVAGQDNDTGIQPQAEDLGVRFFLDRRDRTTVPASAVLDGLELLCQASRSPSLPGRVDVGTVTSQQSMAEAAAKLREAAHEVHARVETMVLRDVPEAVAGTLEESSATGGSAAASGRYASSAYRTRAALERFAAVPDRMAGVMDGLARDVRSIDNAIERNELRSSIALLEYKSLVSGQMTRCVNAMLDAMAGSLQAATSGGTRSIAAASALSALYMAKATLTCADAFRQISNAQESLTLTIDLYDLDLQDAFIGFEAATQGRADEMNQLERELRAQANELQAALEELESLRRSASRALNRALFLDSDESGRIFRSHSFLRRRHATVVERYNRARRRAIGMAWLAKKAIEQRFAISLASLDEDMSLVEAPARWHNDLCSLEGLDFDRLTSTIDDESPEFADYHYADEYIGEYVSKLEQFVESYRLDFPFQSATDTAVISLRDDIVRTRAHCPVPSRNLLYEAGRLESLAVSEITPDEPELRQGWSLTGCNAGTCILVREAGGAGPSSREGTDPDAYWSSGVPEPYAVTFRPTAVAGVLDEVDPCDDDPDYCGFTTDAVYGQDVLLEPGVYRVSWFGLSQAGLGDPGAAVHATRVSDGSELGVSPVPFIDVPARADIVDGEDWRRYYFDFTLGELTDVRVGLQYTSAITAPVDVRVAGLMLERVENDTSLPGAWADTGQTREVMQQVCEDTDGVYFRDEGWVRNCVYLCTDGYGATCSGEDAERYCYREIEFVIDQAAIDRGDILSRAGFAIGNFNYRAERVGVNFVGTNLRDCSASENPSTCFASGFVPYSLEHIGPYYARNHLGGDYSAPLFQGTIEHARGLAAERYLTNPISSTDRALVDPYMQTQFRGRPLNGTYRLRIWDVDGIRFENLEDVQVVLDYRFWTRFE
ncbi:MAG TPA: hypothetical protein RMI62_29370 [Polyangiaceae bacterium LLY-WYZ-15_(1-7)]|nr:hypothetical protein [Polyangiaceae bacterium LLY-WYZ-15_(1-7)]